MDISSLPEEILLHTLNFLPKVDLIRAGQVCQLWHRISGSAEHWVRAARMYGVFTSQTVGRDAIAAKELRPISGVLPAYLPNLSSYVQARESDKVTSVEPFDRAPEMAYIGGQTIVLGVRDGQLTGYQIEPGGSSLIPLQFDVPEGIKAVSAVALVNDAGILRILVGDDFGQLVLGQWKSGSDVTWGEKVELFSPGKITLRFEAGLFAATKDDKTSLAFGTVTGGLLKVCNTISGTGLEFRGVASDGRGYRVVINDGERPLYYRLDAFGISEQHLNDGRAGSLTTSLAAMEWQVCHSPLAQWRGAQKVWIHAQGCRSWGAKEDQFTWDYGPTIGLSSDLSASATSLFIGGKAAVLFLGGRRFGGYLARPTEGRYFGSGHESAKKIGLSNVTKLIPHVPELGTFFLQDGQGWYLVRFRWCLGQVACDILARVPDEVATSSRHLAISSGWHTFPHRSQEEVRMIMPPPEAFPLPLNFAAVPPVAVSIWRLRVEVAATAAALFLTVHALLWLVIPKRFQPSFLTKSIIAGSVVAFGLWV